MYRHGWSQENSWELGMQHWGTAQHIAHGARLGCRHRGFLGQLQSDAGEAKAP